MQHAHYGSLGLAFEAIRSHVQVDYPMLRVQALQRLRPGLEVGLVGTAGMQGTSPRVDIQLVVDVRCDAPASDMDAYGSPVVTATLRSGAAAAASSDSLASAAKRRLFSTDASRPSAPAAAAENPSDAQGNSALPATPPEGHGGSRGGRAGRAVTPPGCSWRTELGQPPAGGAAGVSTGTPQRGASASATPQRGVSAAETPQRTMLAMREEMAHRLALDYAAQYRCSSSVSKM